MLENKMFNRWGAGPGVQIMTNVGQKFSSGRIDKLDLEFNTVFIFSEIKGVLYFSLLLSLPSV